MKVKLTEGLAYLAGFWKMSRTREGVGVVGNAQVREHFIKLVLDAKLVEASKIRLRENSALFHHSAYRQFFLDFVRTPHERLKHRNALSAAYIAGLFDACGALKEGIPYFEKIYSEDEMVLARLDFAYLRARGRLVIAKRDAEAFMQFINPYLIFRGSRGPYERDHR